MNAENARRLAERLEIERLKISVEDVEAYREVHYPGSKANHDAFLARGGIDVPGDGHVAKLPHDRFHEWFGTVCDDTCPHARSLPPAHLKPRPWWKQLFARKA